MKIIECFITPIPDSIFGKMPEVHVTYEDSKKEMLFFYYPDEISFNYKEFIGLTRNQALTLRQKKDIAFLQS
jgi:hypothetical protein